MEDKMDAEKAFYIIKNRQKNGGYTVKSDEEMATLKRAIIYTFERNAQCYLERIKRI